MLREQLLQQKLRKSESLAEKDIYSDFMEYAREVSDQMEIYLYMQENQIGIDQAKYWIARMEILRKRCQFIELVRLVNSLRNDGNIEESWEISKYQRNLLNFMRNVFNMQHKGKRRAADYNKGIEAIHPEKRKIGNIQVYVDEACRFNYELDDLAEFIEHKMGDYCQIEREEYKRAQERKSPSFIAKREQHLIDLAQQVLDKAGRKSHQERKSLGPRLSNKINLHGSNKFEVDNFNTPKTSDLPQVQSTDLRGKKKKDSSRDSIEILKSMRKDRREQGEFSSPKFIETSHVFSDCAPEAAEYPIERCRAASESNNDFLSFSFGKSRKSPQDEQRQRVMIQRELQNKDHAFMFNSFSQDSRFLEKQNLSVVRKEDFELELIIKEIQRENYEKLESKTFSSEIDSNQENQCFKDFFRDDSGRKQRKPFEILLEAESRLLNPNKNMKLEELMDFDDSVQNRNPEDRSFQNEYNVESAQKRRTPNPNPNHEFRSQTKNYLSNIKEQNSSFYSHSKNKYTRSSK